MIGGQRVLALIPARGGSKGLPGKNILPVGGKPLIGWTIEAARIARHVDRVVVSSDDERILDAARGCGCEVPFRRPAQLATDETPMIDVVLHALDQLPEYGIVVLLQPTSPLRTAADIDAACATLEQDDVPACVSVSPVEQSPYWMYRLTEDRCMTPLLDTAALATRRQDLPEVFALNGALYVARVEWLREHRTFVTKLTRAHVMPAERSVDIDTAADLEAFKRILTEHSHVQVSA